MHKQKIMKFRDFRVQYRYEILLVSFLILIFGDVFFGPNIDPMPFLIFQNVLASTFIFYGKRKWRLPLMLFLVFLTILELLDYFVGFARIRMVFSLSYIVYFILLAVQVYRQIIRAKDVDVGMIAAVLCGFIILGLVGGSAFSIIEYAHRNSFTNLAEGAGGFADLIYFSFITILSIGYGDITPASDLAQKMAMFFGLIGYFYGVVVIGIIMGKYVSRKQ